MPEAPRAGRSTPPARFPLSQTSFRHATQSRTQHPGSRQEPFEYLLNAVASQGFAPTDMLHTAQSLFHDHVPAKRFGLATAWIDRRHEQTGWGATPPAEGADYEFRFNSLGEMAEVHRRELQGAV